MQLSDRDKSYIYDMLSYSLEIMDIIKDESHNSFMQNRIKRLAVERLIEVIGEAANHISQEVIKANDDIPWSKIIGLRNKIAHDYGEILTDRIWLIASKSIPELVELLKSKKIHIGIYPMKSPAMIIFDYGNTLIYEKELDLERAYKALYAQIHKNPDKIDFITFYEKGMAIFEKVKSRALQNDVEIHTHNFYNCLFQILNVEFNLSYTELEILFWEALAPCRAMPNIEKLLLFLEAKNIRTAVISNIAFSEKALTARINKYLPRNKFEFIIASSEYGFRKPDCLLFEAALKKACLSADEVWYCGDNPRADVIGSAALGIKPVLYTSSFACPYDNENHISPNFEFTKISDWDELIELIEG